MVQVSYPGVYIQEVPSGVRTIAGVATSITAFVGSARKGATDVAVPIKSFADFERSFGGLDVNSVMSYAVRQFYANGGATALVVRVAKNATTARWNLADAGATVVLDVDAASPGAWGNDLRLSIEHTGTLNQDVNFNLLVWQQTPGTNNATLLETHRNLSMDPTSAQYVASVVNNASTNVQLTVPVGLTFTDAGFALAAAKVPTGTVTDSVISGTVSDADGNPRPFRLELSNNTWAVIDDLAADVTAAINANGVVNTLLAASKDADLLKLASTKPGVRSAVSIAVGAAGGLAALLKLGLANGGREVTGATQHRPSIVDKVSLDSAGSDGVSIGAAEMTGSTLNKKGMHALDDVDLFNLLVIPETAQLVALEADTVITEGINLCAARRAFFIVDPPNGMALTDVPAWASSHRPSNGSNAAAYFPAVQVVDPLDGFRARTLAPSGTLAGVYARTDSTRGVWKAPAGSDATLNGVIGLALPINDLENGDINPLGINALRSFPAQGRVVWGARTLRGADALADEYKYVPIRRLALFIEESLYRGTQWVVFEPNDEPLYAQIRLNIGAFMNGLFRQGAFQGKSPQEAYFVKCDGESTTQADRNLGIVNILVGFAPLKPAEFVVLSIQQIAGDL
jgi:phage tail sheath protein FI